MLFLLRLWKSGAWENLEVERSYTEAHWKDFFQDHGNATVVGQDLMCCALTLELGVLISEQTRKV